MRTDLRWGIRLVGFEFIGWAAVMETPVGCGQYEGGDGGGKRYLSQLTKMDKSDFCGP